MPRGKAKSTEAVAKSSKELEGARNSLKAARAYLTKKKGKEFTEQLAEGLRISLGHRRHQGVFVRLLGHLHPPNAWGPRI